MPCPGIGPVHHLDVGRRHGHQLVEPGELLDGRWRDDVVDLAVKDPDAAVGKIGRIVDFSAGILARRRRTRVACARLGGELPAAVLEIVGREVRADRERGDDTPRNQRDLERIGRRDAVRIVGARIRTAGHQPGALHQPRIRDVELMGKERPGRNARHRDCARVELAQGCEWRARRFLCGARGAEHRAGKQRGDRNGSPKMINRAIMRLIGLNEGERPLSPGAATFSCRATRFSRPGLLQFWAQQYGRTADAPIRQPCFSFLWIAPIPPSHGSDERNQFCFFGMNSRRCRRMPTRTM